MGAFFLGIRPTPVVLPNNVMHTIRQEVLPGMGCITLMHSIRQVANSGMECIAPAQVTPPPGLAE
jgi:hypothetical protein